MVELAHHHALMIFGELQSDASRHVEWTLAAAAMANADAQLLRVVLVKLLGNAWKFTAERPCAHIEFGATYQDDGSVAYEYLTASTIWKIVAAPTGG